MEAMGSNLLPVEDGLRVGEFVTRLEQRGYPITADSLPGVVAIADKVITSAELDENAEWVVLYLEDNTTFRIEARYDA
jgi:hypothetical protein